MLRLWDGRMSVGSAEAALYSVFTERMLRRLLQPCLEDLTERVLEKGPTPLLGEWSVLGQKSLEWLRRELEDEESPWFAECVKRDRDRDGDGKLGRDSGSDPGREALLAKVLMESWEEITRLQGADPSRWEYGKLHTHWFVHFLGTLEVLVSLFNRGPYPIGGDGTTIWASPARRQEPSATRVGPPFRFVTDLGDPRESFGVLAPGQSGRLSSPHYDDQTQAWLSGEYHRMLFAREDVEQEALTRLHLESWAAAEAQKGVVKV
jgi:penicillin amidase